MSRRSSKVYNTIVAHFGQYLRKILLRDSRTTAMSKMLSLVGLLCVSLAVVNAQLDITSRTDLKFVFLVHRHGDSTPVPSTLIFSDEPEEVTKDVAKYGWNQLINLGKLRSYRLGEFIRSNYNTFLSAKYNESEVYIRSTDSARAKMSILTALAAIYPPPTPSWNTKINWDPVPYTTVEAKYDFNFATVNCPAFEKIYKGLFNTSVPSMNQYSDLLTTLSPLVNFDLVSFPAQIYGVYELFQSLLSLGVTFNPDILDVFPQIEEAAGVAVDHVMGNDQYINLQAGTFLEEFFKYADKTIQGQKTPRMRIYSGDDFNVYSLQAVTRVTERQGIPKYSSLYALELRKVRSTGEYVVVPMYLPEPGSGVKQLEIQDCGALCDYETFRNITNDYVLDTPTWRSKCGWTQNIHIDSTEI
ncbi:hypothetical protein ACJJTC_013117 [Scirpophaga incertulas]